MKPIVKIENAVQEYFFQEGCFILEVSNSADDPEMSIVRARVETGKTTRWHRLKGTTERYYVLEGQGFVELSGHLSKKIKTGDVVIIPAMCSQRITNIGKGDLVFLAICTPRFLVENYQDIEAEMGK